MDSGGGFCGTSKTSRVDWMRGSVRDVGDSLCEFAINEREELIQSSSSK